VHLCTESRLLRFQSYLTLIDGFYQVYATSWGSPSKDVSSSKEHRKRRSGEQIQWGDQDDEERHCVCCQFVFINCCSWVIGYLIDKWNFNCVVDLNNINCFYFTSHVNVLDTYFEYFCMFARYFISTTSHIIILDQNLPCPIQNEIKNKTNTKFLYLQLALCLFTYLDNPKPRPHHQVAFQFSSLHYTAIQHL
jgi:hypothetical protein